MKASNRARHLLSALLVDKERTRSFRTEIEPATSRVGTGCSTTELRLHMAEAITLIIGPHSDLTDKERAGNPAVYRLARGSNPLAVSRVTR